MLKLKPAKVQKRLRSKCMDIKKIISEMTLEEKAGMCCGTDFWHTRAIERLGIPATMVSDGPHGLRKQDIDDEESGANDSIKAVCFPAACATAASFDKEMIYKMGQILGDECQHEGLSVILGPAVNIKRSPLCGRNFEYFSEDPYLATTMSGSYVKGVQSKNVGVSMKHFAANNQEYRRMSTDSRIDERTLREIYLAAFEGAVKDAKPWTIMCSYNKINGTYGSENPFTLTEVLRDEWGFDGYVMSDWGAVNERVKALEAGLELEMPSSYGENDKLIVKAVKEGALDESVLDRAVERILNIVDKYVTNMKPDTPWDKDAHHVLSGEFAADCAVLLKNDGILPLKKSGKIAFIGKYAKAPRFQGGGSSHINCIKTESAMDAVKDKAYGINAEVVFSKGYDDIEDVIDEELINEAVKSAAECEVAVIFAGLPDAFESEGYDRVHMSMPDCQNELIRRVAEVQPNTVVVLHNGSPVEMPWRNDVKGILEMYLGGEAVGAAEVKLLFGDANPSGHLPESFPIRFSDNSSYLFFPGKNDVAEYREGIYVGYRYYDKRDMEVAYPFGHGLSYTEFAYSDMSISSDKITDADELTVSVKITNIGKVSGACVPQVYVEAPQDRTDRPIRELKGYDKVFLNPGESKTVSFTLNSRAFAFWDVDIHDWYVESGKYIIAIGNSSRDIVVRSEAEVTGLKKKPVIFNYSTPLGDIAKYEKGMELLKPMLEGYLFLEEEETDSSAEAITDVMKMAIFNDMPIRNLLSFGGGIVTNEMIYELIDKMNELKIEEN